MTAGRRPGKRGRAVGSRKSQFNLREHYPAWIPQAIVALLFRANVLNIGADLGAMAQSARLLIPLPARAASGRPGRKSRTPKLTPFDALCCRLRVKAPTHWPASCGAGSPPR